MTERETGYGETVLADYESDLESFSPERLVSVINQQGGSAPSRHDPNEALDQISEDNLTQYAPQDEDEATRTARRAKINIKENAGPKLLSVHAFPRATSTTNSTTLRIQSSEPQSPQ